MITVGFCNLKGGVGKTTACQNIAAGLAKMGRKVAVVDMDPQSNLSAGFGITPSPTDPQVFDLLSGEAKWDDIVITKEGIDIIPSSLSLVMAELNNEGPVSRAEALRDALSEVAPGRYDYMLLDSPPQLGIFTRNVLAACNKIIVPMDGGFYSLFGLRLLSSSINVFRERLNPELEIAGILMTNYNPRLFISKQIYNDVRKTFGDLLFESYIRQNISIVEASSMGASIFEYEPKSKGAECYRQVTREFVRRLEGENAPVNFVDSKPATKPAPKPATPAPAVKHEPEPTMPEPIPTPVQESPTPAPIPTPTQESQKPTTTPTPTPVKHPKGDYEKGIINDVIDMLPESEKGMWIQIFAPISDVSRGEIDVHSLRDDFEDSDKDRYTFYVLNDESDTFWPVMYPDQIIEPLRCVIKLDEYGAAEVYM